MKNTKLVDKITKDKTQGSRSFPHTEKIIIKTERAKYSDVLRTIKNNVDIDEVGAKIKTNQKNNQRRHYAEALKREIQYKNATTC